MIMKIYIVIFWVMLLYSLRDKYQGFRETYQPGDRHVMFHQNTTTSIAYVMV